MSKIPLNELITLQRGFDLPKDKRISGVVPVVASTGIAGFHNEAKVKADGVVIGRSGSIGGGQYITEDFFPLNTTLYVKDFKGHHPRFIYYLLKNIDFTVFNVGTGVPTLNRNHLSSLLVNVFDREKEEKIADILGNLDDKIQLNTQINQTLEQIAQAVFKSWFIDFDPVRAKATAKAQGTTDDQAEQAAMSVISGKSPAELTAYRQTHPNDYEKLAQLARHFPSEFDVIDGVEVPKGWGREEIGSIIQSKRIKIKNQKAVVLSAVSSSELVKSDEYFSKQVYSKSIEKYLQVNQWDFAYNPSRINIGSIGMLKENITGAVSPVYEVFSVKENYHWYMEKIISQQYVKDYISTLSSGSVRQSLKLAEFSLIPCIVPDIKNIQCFNFIYELILEKVQSNISENKVLSETRDLLLPKLLSE